MFDIKARQREIVLEADVVVQGVHVGHQADNHRLYYTFTPAFNWGKSDEDLGVSPLHQLQMLLDLH
jgi:hypothetical protein